MKHIHVWFLLVSKGRIGQAVCVCCQKLWQGPIDDAPDELHDAFQQFYLVNVKQQRYIDRGFE